MHEKPPKQEPQSAVVENAVDTGDIQLSPLAEKELVNKILNDYQLAGAQRTEWINKKAAGLKLYWGIRDSEKNFPFKNCSDVRVPLIRTLKETLHSNVWASFDLEEPFDVLPVGLEDVEKARKVRKFLNWQFTNEIDFEQMLDGILDHCLVYGHSVVKTTYLKEARINKVQGEGGMQSTPEVTFDGIKTHLIDPEQFLFPPYACHDDVQDLDYVIHEIPMTSSDIRRRMASAQYRQVKLDAPKSSGNNYTDVAIQNVKNKHVGTYSFDKGTDAHGSAARHHKVIEWYGFYDIDEDGIEENIMVTMLHDSREILRLVVWDISRPFVIVRFSPLVNSPWGESIADLIGQINEELNTLHNQRVDAVTLNNIPYGFYDPLSGFDPENIQLVPGLMIPTNGPPSNAVHFPVHNAIRPEMYREEEMLAAYAERLIGAGANIKGTENSSTISATEVATIDKRAGIRFKLVFSRIQRGMEKLAKSVLELNQKLMPAEKQIRVMGPNDSDPLFGTGLSHMNFTKSEMQGKFDIKARGQSIVEKDLNRQNQMMTYQIGIMSPLIMTDPESMFYLTRDTLEALGAKNRELYLKKPQYAVPQNPEDEQARIAQGEDMDPVLGENVEYHFKKHAEFINSPNFGLLTPESQTKMMIHLQKTMKLQQVMKQLQAVAQQKPQQSQGQPGAGRTDSAAEGNPPQEGQEKRPYGKPNQ